MKEAQKVQGYTLLYYSANYLTFLFFIQTHKGAQVVMWRRTNMVRK